MSTFVERIQALIAKDNKLNKALYQNWYSFGLPITPSRNYTADLIDGYNNNEVVYSIINKIARPASEVPLQIVNEAGEVLDDHWANNLIRRPNEDFTMSEIIFSYYVYLLGIGNSFLYAPKMSDGRALELLTMPSNVTDIVAGDWKNPVKGYVVRYGAETEDIDKKYVMHSKLFNPKFTDAINWQYGLSPIEVAIEVIKGIDAGNKRQTLLAETGAPPFIISSQTPEGLTDQQQEQLEATYKRKYTGIANVNEPMLTGTPVKVERIGTSAADLELIKANQNATRILCNVYGISSALLNDFEGATFSNVKELRRDLYTNTIIPLNKILENKLTTFLLGGEDAFFKFNYDTVEVLSSTIDERMIALNPVTFLTDNEKRDIFGYEEIVETLPTKEEVDEEV